MASSVGPYGPWNVSTQGEKLCVLNDYDERKCGVDSASCTCQHWKIIIYHRNQKNVQPKESRNQGKSQLLQFHFKKEMGKDESRKKVCSPWFPPKISKIFSRDFSLDFWDELFFLLFCSISFDQRTIENAWNHAKCCDLHRTKVSESPRLGPRCGSSVIYVLGPREVCKGEGKKTTLFNWLE